MAPIDLECDGEYAEQRGRADWFYPVHDQLNPHKDQWVTAMKHHRWFAELICTVQRIFKNNPLWTPCTISHGEDSGKNITTRAESANTPHIGRNWQIVSLVWCTVHSFARISYWIIGTCAHVVYRVQARAWFTDQRLVAQLVFGVLGYRNCYYLSVRDNTIVSLGKSRLVWIYWSAAMLEARLLARQWQYPFWWRPPCHQWKYCATCCNNQNEIGYEAAQ